MSESLKRSPLEAAHVELGAKLVPFAGWSMPVQYTAILDEHSTVRTGTGIFDISHMGQFFVSGEGAAAWLDRMLTNSLSKLAIGEGQYTFLLNQGGGVIDDLIVYRTGENEFLLVVNASMIEEDFAWFAKHQPENVELRNESELWAGMAVQGPTSAAVFAAVCPGEALPPRNGIVRTASGCIICSTGYTGEAGFEFFAPAGEGAEWFKKFIAAGAKPCGLGCRDSLRLEMGYPLNGNDLSPQRSPLEAGLGFFVDLEKGDFIGHEALQKQKEEGVKSRLVALQYTDKGAPPRAHYTVHTPEGDQIGELSSGVHSPSLGTGIGLAYLPVEFAKIGTEVQIDVRGRRFPAKVVKKPFYKPTTKA